MQTIVWDIETGPLPSDVVLRRVMLRATNVVDDRDAVIAKWIKEAALNPETSQVMAIGYGYESGESAVVGVTDTFTEEMVLEDFWARCKSASAAGDMLVGFNTSNFDLPYVVRRSWYTGVEIPHGVLPDKWGKWGAIFYDLLTHWSLKVYGSRISLNLLCECLGLKGKNGSGADFAALWLADKAKATEYLLNDLRMTWEVGRKFDLF